MKIFLIGFMGSGKTTAARKLAARMSWWWDDLDRIIEQGEGMPVVQIFEKKGEQAFRDLEHQYLMRLDQSTRGVIATGGGTPCYHGNMDYMNEAGLTVYLEMTPEQLYSRLKDTQSHRPLLKGMKDEELFQYIAQKTRERAPFYQRAHIRTPGFDLNIRALEKGICDRLKQ